MTTSENILSEIIDELRPLPHAQRAALARVYRRTLDEDDCLRLLHAWELHALVHAVTELMIRRIPLKIWV